MPDNLHLPDVHAAFLAAALERLQTDVRLVGVAAGGSVLTGLVDEYSDLDLVIAVEPASFQAVLAEGQRIAADLGPLLAAFTGEHVAEPRLLICLYGPPLLHVDLKFVSLPDLAERVEDPLVLWEREGRVRAALSRGTAAYPQPDLQWIEDRFWPWVHYTGVKIARGELFEALDALAFLRGRVLGPLALVERGAQPQGLRRIEMLAPDSAAAMRRTVGGYDATLCAEALLAAADLYRRLRTQLAPAGLAVRSLTEEAVLEHLAEITERCGQPDPLRGFLNGKEPDDANYFHFSATLRIHGDGVPLEEISQRLAVEPTHLHRKGERRGPHSPAWRDDAWHFTPALRETEPLERHVAVLWEVVRPHVEYLRALKERFTVDIFCGYRSNCDTRGLEVSHECLELFTALEVPFGISVIIA